MTEKKLLERIIILALLIVAIFAAVQISIDYKTDNYYTDIMHLNLENDYDPDDLEVTFDKPDIVELRGIQKMNQMLIMTLYGLKAGEVTMMVQVPSTGETLVSYNFRVTPLHQVVNLENGNFSSYQDHTLSLIVFLIAIAFLLFYGFHKCMGIMRYSYQAIFYSGFFVYICALTIILSFMHYNNASMFQVYSTLQQAGYHFIFYSFPVIVLFAIAMTTSNISLIRHERFRIQNILGIEISLAMIIGALIAFIGYGMVGDQVVGMQLPFQIKIINKDILMTLFTSYTSIYCLMECFLLGSIICGILSATHEPELDKDYLIILGCRVRKDGTLMPLIRGRVDRAIAFYKKQLKQTGKKAVFVPSGGQGSDEQVSEGDAMKRYLLEQGFGEEEILVENRSKNTKENMLFSKKLIENAKPDARIAFSTTNYHVFRSGIISRQNHFYPDGMASSTKWYFWPNAYVREMIGMISYLWKRLLIIVIPIIVFFAILQYVF